ncbi:MAG: bifunctional alpha,alpha-trehalose-phosphate synthase (UDP-forming)/trehalose-phosphatase [Candidatus Riflebacteria bacterium]|nr:bifunctional alpha,alpha-trehalose-phosphate synthase (UDP-forming)/trehalose-phosphatase [Candidatus Riflebacteria bacterium]
MPEPRILLVSNRLPVTVKTEHGKTKAVPSPGGLATALRGPHEQADSLWIGWPGDTSRVEPADRPGLERQLASLRCHPVPLSPTEVAHFYDGFSNGVLWPLYHYLTDKVEREAWSNWRAYVEVNQKFAEAIQSRYRPGDMIWIHDYQLSLVPAILRNRLPEATIGFFLHIPFPSSEVFRILPWRTEILQGMLGADLIGFHTYSYLHHFSRALLHVLDLPVADGMVRLGHRQALLGVFPIGIDAPEFEALAAEPAVQEDARQIRAGNGPRQMILGVDRLDYTKGLTRRLMSIERLLEREPAWRDRFRYVQLIVPSREKVDAYAALRRELDELAGRINATWGTISSLPVHSLYRGVSRERLVALYQAADVMLVTPLRDGMNLVAKEFAACRHDEGGVLVLSEFAGAAAELVEALTVNPYDLDRMALQIKRALQMPDAERQSRMRSLRARVRGFDAHLWAATFLEALRAAGGQRLVPGAAPQVSDEAELEKILERILGFAHLHVVLDYDGTLVPFADTPDLAIPDPDLFSLLQELAARPQTQIHLLSGRTRAGLERWFGHLPIFLHAEHGFWSRAAGSRDWRPLMAGPPAWLPRIRSLLEKVTRETPGSMIEEKSNGVVWHYRLVEPDFGHLRAAALLQTLRKETAQPDLEVLEGEKAIEIRRKGAHKGMVIQRLFEESAGAAQFLALGDDRTDEDMFQAIGAHGVALHVGPGPSMTPYRLENPPAARAFLRRLLAGGPRNVHPKQEVSPTHER